jgi:hypothetical protein
VVGSRVSVTADIHTRCGGDDNRMAVVAGAGGCGRDARTSAVPMLGQVDGTGGPEPIGGRRPKLDVTKMTTSSERSA